MKAMPRLAYWYRLDRPRAGLLLQETDAHWSVADQSGSPVGAVNFATSGLLQAATYWLSDTAGTPLVGYAEKDGQLLGPDGAPVGGLQEPTIWVGQEAAGKYQVHLDRHPHRFGGAWMWDTADEVVASLGQTRTEGVGAYLQLDRPADLPEPLATVTLVLPFLAHLAMLRATQQDIHRRSRRREQGRSPASQEQSDLL